MYVRVSLCPRVLGLEKSTQVVLRHSHYNVTSGFFFTHRAVFLFFSPQTLYDRISSGNNVIYKEAAQWHSRWHCCSRQEAKGFAVWSVLVCMGSAQALQLPPLQWHTFVGGANGDSKPLEVTAADLPLVFCSSSTNLRRYFGSFCSPFSLDNLLSVPDHEPLDLSTCSRTVG